MISFIANKNQKLSKLLPEFSKEISFSLLMKLLRNKDIKVNDKRIKEDILLNVGDRIEIYYSPKKQRGFDSVFSDNNILVVDKKSGYSSEEIFENIKSEYKTAKFIHRLDRNTCGLMVFALNSLAEKELLFAFKNRAFEKFYTAEVVGKLEKKEDILCGYLVKDSESALVKVFSKKVSGAVHIKTGYKVVEEREKTSIVFIKLFTGKTHQIRAHFAYIGHPLVGDGKYGDNKINKELKAKYQRLCSTKLILHFEKQSPLYYLEGKTFEKQIDF